MMCKAASYHICDSLLEIGLTQIPSLVRLIPNLWLCQAWLWVCCVCLCVRVCFFMKAIKGVPKDCRWNSDIFKICATHLTHENVGSVLEMLFLSDDDDRVNRFLVSEKFAARTGWWSFWLIADLWIRWWWRWIISNVDIAMIQNSCKEAFTDITFLYEIFNIYFHTFIYYFHFSPSR